MRVHFIQHVDFEGPAELLNWAEERSYSVTISKMQNRDLFPEIDDFDMLIVMGGPMSVADSGKYPWLIREKEFIRRAINQDKIVVGICLGAQLIADVLDGTVRKNRYKEIGWFPVKKSYFIGENKVFQEIEKEPLFFHWHGESFDIPKKAKRIFKSQACKNQAFQFGNKVFGFQFHFEMNEESIKALVKNCSEELIDDKYVQPDVNSLLNRENIAKSNELMKIIMDNIVKNKRDINSMI